MDKFDDVVRDVAARAGAIAPAAASDDCVGAHPASASPSNVLPSRVLVVDDEAFIAMDIADVLRDFGVADIHTAASVAQALDCLGDHAFDAAILDLNLSGGSSAPIAEALGNIDVPYAVITGYAPAALPGGFEAVAIVPKPYSIEDLRAVLDQLAARRMPA